MSSTLVRALALLVLFAAAAALARTPLPPYDFTGHWSGTIVLGLQSVPFEADLRAIRPKTFRGTARVNQVECTLRGKRKRQVIIRLGECTDGITGRLKGILDLDGNAVAGAGHLERFGTRTAAQFSVAKAAVAACGNGAVDAGETCDDGNTASGDGCGATCALEAGTVIDEIEPNDSAEEATAVAPLPALVRGAVASGGDEDFFRIEITGSDLLLETLDDGGPGSCSTDSDTVIELRAADGTTVVAFDDDGGMGLCSRLELHGLEPGVYYPCVRAISYFYRVPAYQLLVVGP